MTLPFNPRRKTDKAKLYPVLKALADIDPRKTPELIMDDAVGYPVARGRDYVRNMRRGEIAATYAALIHQWLIEHHFDLAHRLAPDIFPETPLQRWKAILDERATTATFRLVLVDKSMSIVQRGSQLEAVDTNLKLGQTFCLELKSDSDGYAICLQGVRGEWHSVPLGPDGEAATSITSGANRLPRKPSGTLDPLSEHHDEGLHDFVMITGGARDIPTDIKGLISWVADNPCTLHRIKVQVVK